MLRKMLDTRLFGEECMNEIGLKTADLRSKQTNVTCARWEKLASLFDRLRTENQNVHAYSDSIKIYGHG